LVTPGLLLQAKLDGVSSLSDIEYEKKHLRVWKAYGIGSGKEIKISSLDNAKDAQIPTLSTISDEVSDKFSISKSRVKPNSKETESSTMNTTKENDSQDSASAQLFLCTEEGCVKSY
jgi:hypothetical protein